MTDEDAIWQLTKDKEYCMAYPIECGENAYKAYEMAIEALELVGKTDKLEKERDALLNDLAKYCDCDVCKNNTDECLNNGLCKECSVGKTTREHWEWRGVTTNDTL